MRQHVKVERLHSSWEKLVELLLDTSAEFGDRDDAVIDHRQYNEPEVEMALAAVASSPSADVDLIGRCGESLAGIWCRNSHVNRATWMRFRPEAKAIEKQRFNQRPDLVAEF